MLSVAVGTGEHEQLFIFKTVTHLHSINASSTFIRISCLFMWSACQKQLSTINNFAGYHDLNTMCTMSLTFDLEDQGHILFSMVVYVTKIQFSSQ